MVRKKKRPLLNFKIGTRLQDSLIGLAFVLPALIIIGLFDLYPDFKAFFLSLHRWDGFSPKMEWVGLWNYFNAFKDPIFLEALRNNIILILGKLILELSIALFAAIMLNKKIRGRVMLRAGIFVPYITTPIVIAYVWRAIYNPRTGLLNMLLTTVGLSGWTRSWLGQLDTALWAILAVTVWNWWGFQMMIFMSGLQSIPHELYEAARIDGATAFRELIHVTLPMLRPVTTVAVVMSVINGFKIFSIIYVMTAGGPLHATETVSTWIYKNAFEFGKVGYGAALSFILCIFIIVITITQTLVTANRSGKRM